MSRLRHEKIRALLQSTIARYLEGHKDEWGIEALVLVDEVFLAADLKSAQVWVSFNPSTESEDKLVALGKGLKDLQSHLFKTLTMKRVPTISLKLSDSQSHETLERIFDTLESHEGDGKEDFESGRGSE